MAQHHDHHGTMVPQQTNFDNADQPGIAQPYSQSEVEDLLYGDDRPARERLARLRELRDEATTRQSGDWGDHDPTALIEELDRAIDELSATLANAEAGYAGLETTYDNDPADHLHTLAPDDTDARYAIERDDGYFDEPEQADDWDDEDDFRPERERH